MRNIYSRRRYESVEDGDTCDVSEVINYVLERMEDAFPGGEVYYDYDSDPYSMDYSVDVPLQVQSDYVNIKKIQCSCDFSHSTGMFCIRFVGSEIPDPEELLDQYYNGDIIRYGNDYDMFDEYVYTDGKTTEECKREIDRVVDAYKAHHKRTMKLWDEMQEALDRLDDLHHEMECLQTDFIKRMKRV